MSTLKVNTIQNTSGVEQYLAKAWVNFNGTGTVAIRASGNVSSITDNRVGEYTANFTTPVADANYVALGTLDTGALVDYDIKIYQISASQALVSTSQSNLLQDFNIINVAIFR